jgi:ribose/xylose/arabinose/galactoside ABC-type transport system permease subunit
MYGLLDRLGPLVALLFVWCLFAGLSWNTFATWSNTQSILLHTSMVGVAALGGTMIIISGGIDLSVGSLIALVSVVVASVISVVADQAPSAKAYPNVVAAVAAAVGIALATVCA